MPNLLRAPGPTPVPPSVQREMNRPMISHRTKEAEYIISEIREKLKPVFGTEQEVMVIAGSGTLALEASVVNVTTPGDEVLILVTGEFGNQYVNICESHKLKVHKLDFTWGEAVDIKQLEKVLKKHSKIKAVFATFCETSTGVLNPIQSIASTVREYSEALLIVDGVSCIGGVDPKMDEWGVDIYVTGSQKAMMLPPGLAFISLSERAWRKVEDNETHPYYIDLLIIRDFWLKNSTPHTSAVSLLYGLNEVLNLLEDEGLEEVYQRHELMRNMFIKGMEALSIPVLADPKYTSPTVTAIQPKNVDANELRSLLKADFGLELAGGLKHLAGKILRIGHMGYCHPVDVLQIISLFELGLKKLQDDIKLGVGVEAAQLEYLDNHINKKGEKLITSR